MWSMEIQWWEIVVRVALIYGALLVMLRISGKRVMSELDPADLLALLLLSETVSPALTGQDTSVSASLIAAAMLVAACMLTAFLTFRSRIFDRLLEGRPSELIVDGKVNEGTVRRELITKWQLEEGLRHAGVRSTDQVELAMVEPGGEITVIERSPREMQPSLAEMVQQRFQASGASLAIMESCTGGLLASDLVAVPGAGYLLGGVVAYDVAAKVAFGVPASVLEEFGAVSEEVAIAMAAAAARSVGANYGVATTGVAGPDTHDGERPGTVCIAVARPEGAAIARATFSFRGDREDVRRQATDAAMGMLLGIA